MSVRPAQYRSTPHWQEDHGRFPVATLSLRLKRNLQVFEKAYKEWPEDLIEVSACPLQVGRPNSPIPYVVVKRRGHIWMLSSDGGHEDIGNPWTALYEEYDPFEKVMVTPA